MSEFKVGDKVLRTPPREQSLLRWWTKGKPYDVQKDNEGDLYVCDDDGDAHYIDQLDPGEFTLYAEPAPIQSSLQFQEGQTVRIVRDVGYLGGHSFAIGTKVIIISVDRSDTELPYLVRSTEDNDDEQWITADDVAAVPVFGVIEDGEVSSEDDGLDAEELLENVIEELRTFVSSNATSRASLAARLARVLGYEVVSGQLVEVAWED